MIGQNPARTSKALWEGQKSPRFGDDTEEFYASFAKELQLLVNLSSADRVLDIGCGTGTWFQHLRFFEAREYRGVDVSSTMIEEFRRRHPGTALAVGSGERYEDGNTYDLIFLMGVVQYFNRQMLNAQLARAQRMLANRGRIIWAGIPWRPMRFSYNHGALMGLKNAGYFRLLKGVCRQALGSYMGRWYSHNEIISIARRHGMSARIHGSLHHPYRFHAVLEAVPLNGTCATGTAAHRYTLLERRV